MPQMSQKSNLPQHLSEYLTVEKSQELEEMSKRQIPICPLCLQTDIKKVSYSEQLICNNCKIYI